MSDCGSDQGSWAGRRSGVEQAIDAALLCEQFIALKDGANDRISVCRALRRHATMTARRRPQIVSRKQPQQTRSTELVAAILQAAAQVLAEEGAPRFTTARVAERAGVSVGSIYQYFPNKASILFRLQVDEWMQTTRMLRSILEDAGTPHLERLRAVVHAFLRSECEEAEVRGALNDAAPLYRDSPEARQLRADGERMVEAFMVEVLPKASTASRKLAGNLIFTTLSTVGRSFSQTRRTRTEINAFADAMTDMFCAYLQASRQDGRPRAR